MSKQNWVVVSLALLISLFYGINQTALAAETKEHAFIPRCETVDEETENEIESILEILIKENDDRLTNRVNELIASTELLEDEKNILEVAICLEEVFEDIYLTSKINAYHSLLMYGIQMQEEENIQFEEITFTPVEEHNKIQVEGILQGKNEKVFIDHYYSSRNYRALELDLTKEKSKEMEENSSLMHTITSGLASSAFAVLQNPFEKFMDMVDRFFTGKAELEQELFEEESAIHGSILNMRFSLITDEKSTWEQLNMVEYYPSNPTFAMIERATQVHEELPNYWYPKEEIKRGDWNGIAAYYEEYRTEMIEYDSELHDYIFDNALHDSENFEELMEKVKDNNKE